MVVACGVTVVVPLVATAPMSGSMVRSVAPLLCQVISVDPPLIITVSLAKRLTVGGGVVDGATLMVTVSYAVPPGPTAVILYVVVDVGATVRSPPNSISPIP